MKISLLLSLLLNVAFAADLKGNLTEEEAKEAAMDEALANALNGGRPMSSEATAQEIIENNYSTVRDAEDMFLQDSVPISAKPNKDCDMYKNEVEGFGGELQKVAVFGKDDRKEVSSKSSGVVKCKAKNGLIYSSSATIMDVGAGEHGDVITTAEHVLRNKKTGEVYNCFFHPKGDEKMSVRISNAEYGGYRHTGKVDDDWAVATLSKKISHLPGYGAMAIIDDMNDTDLIANQKSGQGSVMIVAYNKKIGSISYAKNCKAYSHKDSWLTKAYPGLYGSDCDANSGASGGMMMYKGANRKGAIGIFAGNMKDESIYGKKEVPDGEVFDPEKAIDKVIKFHDNQRLKDAIESRAKITHSNQI